jgi:tight adherence protein C
VGLAAAQHRGQHGGRAGAGARAEALRARLRRAGQEYALTPQQFFAGKILALVFFGGLGWYLSGEGTTLLGIVVGAALGYMYPDIWLSDHTKKRNLEILKALPFFLDIVTCRSRPA